MFTTYEDTEGLFDGLRIVEEFSPANPSPANINAFNNIREKRWEWFLFQHLVPSEPVQFIAIHVYMPKKHSRYSYSQIEALIRNHVDNALCLSNCETLDNWSFDINSGLTVSHASSLRELLQDILYTDAKEDRIAYMRLPEVNRRMSENGDTNDIALIAIIDAFDNYRVYDVQTPWKNVDEEEEG